MRDLALAAMDDPLKALFEQVQEQSVRPAIEHRADEKTEQPRPLPNYTASKGEP